MVIWGCLMRWQVSDVTRTVSEWVVLSWGTYRIEIGRSLTTRTRTTLIHSFIRPEQLFVAEQPTRPRLRTPPTPPVRDVIAPAAALYSTTVDQTVLCSCESRQIKTRGHPVHFSRRAASLFGFWLRVNVSIISVKQENSERQNLSRYGI